MNMKDEYGHVYEEVWYISQNKDFQKEVQKIRLKYKIPIQGFQGNTLNWIESKWTMKERNTFSEEVKKLFLRCKGAKGESWFVFNPILTSYILTCILEPAFYGLPHEIEDAIRIKRLDNRIEVTLLLGYDSTKKQINDVLKAHWKAIEKMQKKLAGKKIRASDDFEQKQAFWNSIKDQGKTGQELERDFERNPQYLSRYDITKIIKAMDTRIASSFE